jgi:hypothetical protein
MNAKFAIFEKAGKENTDATMALAKENAELLGISSIVIASTWGGNARAALKVFDPKKNNLVVVTHNAHFAPGTTQEFDEKLRKEIIEKGGKVITGTLAFSGVQSALNKQYAIQDFSGLYARLLRDNFSDGVKVCIECVLMACDAGAIQPEEQVLAVAGSGSGADTLCLIKAQTSRMFGKLRVNAILAKPL